MAVWVQDLVQIHHHLSFPIHFTLKTLESIKKQIKNESALPGQHSSLLYVVDCLSNFCSKISHSHKKFLLKQKEMRLQDTLTLQHTLQLVQTSFPLLGTEYFETL